MEIIKDSDGLTSLSVDGKIKILLLTDLHFARTLLSRQTDAQAEAAVRKAVETTSPDFIIVLGDLVYPIPIFTGSNNNARMSRWVSGFMESLGIPWCFVFGNHDEERSSRTTKDGLADIYMQGKNCLFQKGPAEIGGVGNYMLKLKNTAGQDFFSLVFLDSNSYFGKGFFSGFDHVHPDQIEWYKREIAALCDRNGKIIPSFAFMHIPVREFYEAWHKCYMGSPEVTYHMGFVGEKDNYFGYPKTIKTTIFDDMLASGSTKGMFFGHDHVNTVSLTYKGMRLTYPMSIDCKAYWKINKKHTQRGGTVLEISEDGSYTLQHVQTDKLTLD